MKPLIGYSLWADRGLYRPITAMTRDLGLQVSPDNVLRTYSDLYNCKSTEIEYYINVAFYPWKCLKRPYWFRNKKLQALSHAFIDFNWVYYNFKIIYVPSPTPFCNVTGFTPWIGLWEVRMRRDWMKTTLVDLAENYVKMACCNNWIFLKTV